MRLFNRKKPHLYNTSEVVNYFFHPKLPVFELESISRTARLIKGFREVPINLPWSNTYIVS